MHLYLTGYRGSGKTSVARTLASELGVDAIDLDAVIEREAGRTIPELFADEGESGFRDRESEALARVAERREAAVVALGGGAILREENRQVIRRSGRCVWLVARPETLAARIAADEQDGPQRPSLTTPGGDPAEEVARVLEQRQPLYAAAAEHRVEVDDQSIDEIAEQILTWLDQQLT
ncbi:shikimate kinase [Roseimaritima sediminicola]|uniref:shikimate kinase n=1 Tax=Roseimaritima sediminicola TaxID=2662066 RepID=UPI0012983490|nr:shikimate kinase [Roseimaritima sediminicola]